MRRLVMSRSTATLRAANRPSYTIVVSFKSESSGRTSPDRSSDMNGSRPPPSYANTSRSNELGCTLSGVARVLSLCAATREPSSASANTRLAARTRLPSRARTRRLLRPRPPPARRLHERANRELGEQQRAERVAQQFLRGGRCRRELHVLRHDDARQRRDVRQVFADLVVMPVDLEPVAIGVERRSRLGAERLNLAERHAANLRPGRDVVDQRRHLVALRHQAAHQLEPAAVLFTAPAQVLDAAVGEI